MLSQHLVKICLQHLLQNLPAGKTHVRSIDHMDYVDVWQAAPLSAKPIGIINQQSATAASASCYFYPSAAIMLMVLLLQRCFARGPRVLSAAREIS